MNWEFALAIMGITGTVAGFFWKLIDKRLDRIESKVEGIGNRLNRLEERVNGLENRMTQLENRMTHLEGMLQTIVSFLLGHRTGTEHK